MGIFLTFTFTKIWMPFTLFFELNMIAFVVRCFGVQPSWMILVTALFAGKRYSLLLFFKNYSNRYTIVFFSFCILFSSLLLTYLKPANVKILFRFKDSFSRPGIFFQTFSLPLSVRLCWRTRRILYKMYGQH